MMAFYLILNVIGMTIGPKAYAFAIQRNISRIERSKQRASDASKEARTSRKSLQASENIYFEVETGTLHQPGIAD